MNKAELDMVRDIANDLDRVLRIAFSVQDGFEIFKDVVEKKTWGSFSSAEGRQAMKMTLTGMELNARTIMTLKYLSYRLSTLCNGNFSMPEAPDDEDNVRWREDMEWLNGVITSVAINFGTMERLHESFDPSAIGLFSKQLEDLSSLEGLDSE